MLIRSELILNPNTCTFLDACIASFGNNLIYNERPQHAPLEKHKLHVETYIQDNITYMYLNIQNYYSVIYTVGIKLWRAFDNKVLSVNITVNYNWMNYTSSCV